MTLDVVDDVPHVFHIFATFLPEGAQAIDRIGGFVTKHAGSVSRSS